MLTRNSDASGFPGQFRRLSLNRMTDPIRVAILADYAEENWPSMELVAAMLFDALRRRESRWIEPVLVRPRFARRFSRPGAAEGKRFNLDRLLNRFIHYPALARRIRGQFDLFHVIDHSYSHLVHEIPAGRAIVTCHDLHTFRCLLDPSAEPRSWPFRAMVGRILGGMRRAAQISCDSDATRTEVLAHGLAPAARARTIHMGVAPVYSAASDPEAEREAIRLLGPWVARAVELLHVGGTVARKRIDVLLQVFAGLRETFPDARLIRVGGGLTAAQRALAAALRVDDRIAEMPFLDARVLAALYRRAALVLLPSEAEGFGLPLAEAMACGATVLASDIAAFREVGGDAADYAPVAGLNRWIGAAIALLRERSCAPKRARDRGAAAIRRAALFSWDTAAGMTARIYAETLDCPRLRIRLPLERADSGGQGALHGYR
jgi:glycosyltransferase involved in cell wall biosynthesis